MCACAHVRCVVMGEGFRACLTTPQFRLDQFFNGPPRCLAASTALRWEMPLQAGEHANVQPHAQKMQLHTVKTTLISPTDVLINHLAKKKI